MIHYATVNVGVNGFAVTFKV